jgi:uncharacterized membrane-anchored protein
MSQNQNKQQPPKAADTKQQSAQKPRRNKAKEWLISLLITLVVLGIVVALQYWFAKTSGLGMNSTITWMGNAIGGVIMLFIVHHFVKKPDDDGYRP